MTASIDTLDTVRALSREGYKYGFVTDIEADEAPPGLTEDTVAFISAKKDEPEWLLAWRLAAFRAWQKMTPPNWAKLNLAPIDYQAATYYSAPKQNAGPKSLDEVDPELLRTYEKLGIPIREREALAGVAVDAVFDSISVATTFKEELGKLGIIFCSFGEAVREHPDLVRKYLGTVVPQNDNFFAALEFRGVQRRLVCLCAAGRALPDGIVDLLPHQRGEIGPVRAHPVDRRQGRLCQLSRRVHGAAARRKSAACRGRRAHRARRCADQIFDRAELVSGRRRGQGRHLQFRDQAGRLPGRPGQDLVDAGRDRLGDHLEIPELHSRRRPFGRRILFGRDHQQPPAGRYRDQDDPYRQGHPLDDRLEGDFGRARPEHLPRPRPGAAAGAGRAQPYAMRLAADRRALRRPHGPLH